MKRRIADSPSWVNVILPPHALPFLHFLLCSSPPLLPYLLCLLQKGSSSPLRPPSLSLFPTRCSIFVVRGRSLTYFTSRCIVYFPSPSSSQSVSLCPPIVVKRWMQQRIARGCEMEYLEKEGDRSQNEGRGAQWKRGTDELIDHVRRDQFIIGPLQLFSCIPNVFWPKLQLSAPVSQHFSVGGRTFDLNDSQMSWSKSSFRSSGNLLLARRISLYVSVSFRPL